MLKVFTQRDVWRYTAAKTAVAVCLTAILVVIFIIGMFGGDPDATIRVGSVLTFSLVAGPAIAAFLTLSLTYPSARVLRQLSMTRSELFLLSRTDQLTGLMNRRGYDEAANAMLRNAREAQIPASVLMCDIDRFKAINDWFGHEFGDKVLVEFSDLLRTFGERHDLLVARHGGEEFAAFGLGLDAAQAREIAERLRETCAAHQVVNGKDAVTITISVGIATMPPPTALAPLMRAADEALYAAKSAGRNRVVLHSASEESIAA